MSRIENTPGVSAGSVGPAQPQPVRPTPPVQPRVDFAAALLAALQEQGSAGLINATDPTETVGAQAATAQLLRWLAAGVNPGDAVQLLLGLADLPQTSFSGLSLLDRTAFPAGAASVSAAAPRTATGLTEGVSLARLGPQERFQALKPYFVQAERETGVPWQIQAAQWALETGWGRATPKDIQSGRESFNLFGIKGEGPAGSVSAMTTEVVNGMRVTQVAKFRAYGSYAESIVDHARLLTGPYYARAHAAGSDIAKWTEMLGPQQLGYATDPEYSGKLRQIIRENGWDQQA